MSILMQWLDDKIYDPLIQILKRGAEAKQLSFSAALGFTLGIFPIFGVTFFLCGMAIAVLGSSCNAPSVMLANVIATPIQFSLMIPFLRLGEFIAGGPHFPLTTDALRKVLTGHGSREVLLSIMHALLGWSCAAPMIIGALYIIFLPIFKRLVLKFGPTSSPLVLSPREEMKINLRDTESYGAEE